MEKALRAGRLEQTFDLFKAGSGAIPKKLVAALNTRGSILGWRPGVAHGGYGRTQ